MEAIDARPTWRVEHIAGQAHLPLQNADFKESIKVEGASPTAEYSGEVAMKADETITFAVGYGKNKTHYGDTTGLFAKVVLLGDSHTQAR
jgi:hypothetical protein